MLAPVQTDFTTVMCDFTGFERGRHEHKLIFDVGTYVLMVSNGHDREKLVACKLNKYSPETRIYWAHE
jgi:hypothetical protein